MFTDKRITQSIQRHKLEMLVQSPIKGATADHHKKDTCYAMVKTSNSQTNLESILCIFIWPSINQVLAHLCRNQILMGILKASNREDIYGICNQINLYILE
ncbi:hypothetical protein ACH5RR_020555 [Cinchona calisaya]|uniref:Uncharacterized protein n=1 Tax=Cinchona calisaya TaxID=153742 RepID=A0ABD2ZEV2_9GENT